MMRRKLIALMLICMSIPAHAIITYFGPDRAVIECKDYCYKDSAVFNESKDLFDYLDKVLSMNPLPMSIACREKLLLQYSHYCEREKEYAKAFQCTTKLFDLVEQDMLLSEKHRYVLNSAFFAVEKYKKIRQYDKALELLWRLSDLFDSSREEGMWEMINFRSELINMLVLNKQFNKAEDEITLVIDALEWVKKSDPADAINLRQLGRWYLRAAEVKCILGRDAEEVRKHYNFFVTYTEDRNDFYNDDFFYYDKDRACINKTLLDKGDAKE